MGVDLFLENQYKPPRKQKKNLSPPSNLKSFPSALHSVMDGKKITKKEWNNLEIYVLLHDGKLMIKLEDGLLHPMIVSDGDLFGKDWYEL